MKPADIPERPSRRDRTLVLGLALVILLAWPYAQRLRHPSLYADDIVRVAFTRNLPVSRTLFLPFNEHMAPLFDLVTRSVWALTDGRLVQAPLAFTIAGLVPLPIALVLLARVIRRQTGSRTSALVATTVLAMTPLAFETAAWFSASTFLWALAGMLLAFDAAGRRGFGGRSVSAMASAAAPAFSAIGLLAGPLGALRILADPAPDRLRRRWLGAIVPLLGTASYLAVCGVFRYRDVLAESVPRNLDLAAGLSAVARAPIGVLLPALVGLPRDDDPRPLTAIDLFLFAAAMAAALYWAWRNRQSRPLILGGLFLIVGGYTAIYAVRATLPGGVLLHVQRYHLFPLCGLTLLLAAALAPILRRLDDRSGPRFSMLLAVALAAFLLIVHGREFRAKARFYDFPDQPRTHAALDRLEALARREGITRDQALAVLEPIRTRWLDHETLSPLMLLGPTADVPRVANDRVRSTLLPLLSLADREALWGGMDASPYLQAPGPGAAEPVAVARPRRAYRVQPAGDPGHFLAAGWPAFLEYSLPASDMASALGLPVHLESPDTEVEFWWTDADGHWSTTRRIRWQPDPDRWALPLDRLPHWGASHARRVRLAFPEAGRVAVEAPRLLR